ncbi:MAG: acyl-CoA dehydrogenase family protein [Luteolibacter sp.]
MTPPAPANGELGRYTPPVDEYAFLLGEAFGEDIVARASGGALKAEDARDALEGAGEFAAEVFAPLDRLGDPGRHRARRRRGPHAGRLPRRLPGLRRGRLGDRDDPASSGGDGLPGSLQQALTEFWNGSNVALSLAPMLSTGQIHALDADGLREPKTYLTRLVSGEWTGTMNLTEPEAGSDLGAITTIARDNGDGSWSISGQKIFITWGDHDVADNIMHLVLARTEGAPAGHRGLSLFVAPKRLVHPDGSLGARNAVETVAVEHKLGIHASPTCVLQLRRRDRLPGRRAARRLAGHVRHDELGADQRRRAGPRGVGARLPARPRIRGAARAGRVLGRRRRAHDRRGHPDVRRLLLSMASRISALRALVVFAADLEDRAEEGDNEAVRRVPSFRF